MTPPIRLGHRVRDGRFGFEGLATIQTTDFDGLVQFGIERRCEDGGIKPPDCYSAPEFLVEYLGEGIADRATPADDLGFQLGDKVRHTTTGEIGVLVRKYVYLNGCVYFALRLPWVPGEPFESPGHYSAALLERITDTPKPKRRSLGEIIGRMPKLLFPSVPS